MSAAGKNGANEPGDAPGGPDGMGRRQLLRHGARFGAAVALAVVGGEVISHIGTHAGADAAFNDPNALKFVQLSDSHIGFKGTANTDVTGSFSQAIADVNALGFRPDFVMHTGDLTHLSTPAQFDQVGQMMSQLNTSHVFTVPGEHDSVDDHGEKYRAKFGAGTKGDGWYSFDAKGVHLISLVNTLALEKLGHLGTERLGFIEKGFDPQSQALLSPLTELAVLAMLAWAPARRVITHKSESTAGGV